MLIFSKKNTVQKSTLSLKNNKKKEINTYSDLEDG